MKNKEIEELEKCYKQLPEQIFKSDNWSVYNQHVPLIYKSYDKQSYLAARNICRILEKFPSIVAALRENNKNES